MRVSLLDRLISITTYFTIGLFGLVWLIISLFAKKRISPFLSFNIYQSIFISIVLAIISLLYNIAINFTQALPFIGKFASKFDLFFNQTPIYLGSSISGLLVTVFVIYLCLVCLIGKRPNIPYISNIVKDNFGG